MKDLTETLFTKNKAQRSMMWPHEFLVSISSYDNLQQIVKKLYIKAWKNILIRYNWYYVP